MQLGVWFEALDKDDIGKLVVSVKVILCVHVH